MGSPAVMTEGYTAEINANAQITEAVVRIAALIESPLNSLPPGFFPAQFFPFFLSILFSLEFS